MKCKYCNEEMPEKGNFCPICGGDNSLEPEIIIDPEELIFDEADLPADEMTVSAEEPMEEAHFEAPLWYIQPQQNLPHPIN